MHAHTLYFPHPRSLLSTPPLSNVPTPKTPHAFYEKKEIAVYFKTEDGELVLLTAIARYGSDFSRDPNEP